LVPSFQNLIFSIEISFVTLSLYFQAKLVENNQKKTQNDINYNRL